MNKPVGPGQALTTSDAVIYSSAVHLLLPDMLEGVLLCNTTAGSITVTLGRVPAGASLTSTNHFISAVTVEANDTAWYATHLILSPGMRIIGVASGAGVNAFLLVLQEYQPQ